MNTYKYFLIYDRNKRILYGECIEWRCGEFDLQKLKDVTINLKKKYKARFITSDKRLDVIADDDNVILFPDNISFKYEERYDEFITKRSDELIFNPLIDRCCDINSFVSEGIKGKEFIHWVEEFESLLTDIKNRFDLDLLKRPELINSYTFYNPVRLIPNCRFTDKPKYQDNRLPTKMKVTFHDEFQEYQDATYEVTGYFEASRPELHVGRVSEGDVDIVFNESPEQLEVLIKKKDKCIYNSKHGFIRNIMVSGKIIESSITLENGEKVSKYTTLDIDVGR
ncbi:hypothetical protein C9E85_15640 [Plesiomonas shigelloides]|uniref:hypothetical protein n=1 Tax=Plesiomonas shigelloides TaxID=703 RepID=UPI000D5638F9|nr:hypothetical protein [Plesiomonas shigelloides]PVU64931.1 hypothetical protein C9E85_15640 [Plesiomonas shigelloides]